LITGAEQYNFLIGQVVNYTLKRLAVGFVEAGLKPNFKPSDAVEYSLF
jgi:hypothetical protein